MDSRAILPGEKNQVVAWQEAHQTIGAAAIRDNPQRASSAIGEIFHILMEKDVIGRDDINAINRKYREIDEQERDENTSTEVSSERVLDALIRKVKLISKARDNVSAKGVVSLFFLSKFSDLPRIIDVFNQTIAELNKQSSKKRKELERHIIEVMPYCESEKQFEKDVTELLKVVNPSLGGGDIDQMISKKIRLIRKMSGRRKEQRKKEEEYIKRLRFLGDAIPDVGKKTSVEEADRSLPSYNKADPQPEEVHSVLATLEDEILSIPDLKRAIQQAKAMKEQENHDNILVFLGTTQVGKSSTLNFLSRQTPFIERGFVYPSDFEREESFLGFSLDKEDAMVIIRYLVEQGLLRWVEQRQCYIPLFRNGERILAVEKKAEEKIESEAESEKKALRDFISQKFPHKENQTEIYNFVISQLAGKAEKKEKSQKGRPCIGFRSPIFSYGFGLYSTTIVAQAKQQDWNVTTLDLPGTGDIRNGGYRLVSAYSTFTSLSKTKMVRGAVILLSHDQLLGQSTTAQSLIAVLKSADNILGEAIDMDNIFILVTKVPLQVTEIDEITGEEGKRLLSESEIRRDIDEQLRKFYQILSRNTSVDNQRLTNILKKVIDNQRFMPVTPLRKMDEFSESALETNVNIENREEIIRKLSELRPVKVTENYFWRTYSSQNGNISEIIGLIQDEVLKISAILNNKHNELKKLFEKLERKHTLIKISIGVAQESLQSLKSELRFEQLCFAQAIEEYVAVRKETITFRPLDDNEKFRLSQKAAELKLRVEEIKKLAIIRAKQRAINEPSRDEDQVYQSSTKKKIAHLDRIIKGRQAEIENTKEDLASFRRNLEEVKAKNAKTKERSNVKNLTRDEYWYQGDQVGTIPRPHNDYPLRADVEIKENAGRFQVQIAKEINARNNTWDYTVKATKIAGLFSKYKLSAQLYLEWETVDKLAFEMEKLESKLADLEAEYFGLKDKQEKFRSLEENERKLHESNQVLKDSLAKQKEDYLRNLSEIQEKIKIKGDETQFMSMTDIRKVMIGTIAANCEKELYEAKEVKKDIRRFFRNPKTQADIGYVRRAMSSYGNLISQLEIDLFNNDNRFDSSIKYMTIKEMRDTFNEIETYEKKFQDTMRSILGYMDQMQKINSEIEGLRLNIDELDTQIVRFVEEELLKKDKKIYCTIS